MSWPTSDRSARGGPVVQHGHTLCGFSSVPSTLGDAEALNWDGTVGMTDGLASLCRTMGRFDDADDLMMVVDPANDMIVYSNDSIARTTRTAVPRSVGELGRRAALPKPT